MSPCLWQLCRHPRQPGMGPACLSPQVSGPLAPARPSPSAFLWSSRADNQLVQLPRWLLQTWAEDRTGAKPLNTERKPPGGLHPLPTLLKTSLGASFPVARGALLLPPLPPGEPGQHLCLLSLHDHPFWPSPAPSPQPSHHWSPVFMPIPRPHAPSWSWK